MGNYGDITNSIMEKVSHKIENRKMERSIVTHSVESIPPDFMENYPIQEFSWSYGERSQDTIFPASRGEKSEI